MSSEPSTVVQVMVTIIPIVGIVMGSVVAFFYLLWRHKQRLLMIEKGIPPHQVFDLSNFSLLAGLLNVAVGLTLFIFFVVKEGGSYSTLGGLVPLAVGISLLVFFVMRKNRPGA